MWKSSFLRSVDTPKPEQSESYIPHPKLCLWGFTYSFISTEIRDSKSQSVAPSCYGDCTCSGLREGGTQVYSSRGNPLSSSDVELRFPSVVMRRVRLRSSTRPDAMSWTSGGHLQWRHIFLQTQKYIACDRLIT